MNSFDLLTETLHKHSIAIEKAVHSADDIKISETLKNVPKTTLEQLVKHNMGYSGSEHSCIKHIKKELADRSNNKKVTAESFELNEISKNKVRQYLSKAKDNLFYHKEKKSMDSINDMNKRTKRTDRQKMVTNILIKARTKGINLANKKLQDS